MPCFEASVNRSLLFFPFSPAGWTKKLRRYCTKDVMLVQQSPCWAIVFWQGTPLSEHTGQHSQPLAESAVQMLIGCWFSNMLVRQKLVVRSASVRQGPVHTKRMSAGIYCTWWFRPIFCLCVRGLKISIMNFKSDFLQRVYSYRGPWWLVLKLIYCLLWI